MKLPIMFVVVAGIVFCLAPASADQSKTAPKGASEIAGIDLRFDSAKPTFGEAEGPAFSVHAATGKQASDLRLWSLEDAKAIIYRKPEENLVLISKSMTFDLENKAAQLAGGVRLTTGNLVVDVADMAWDDKSRTAKSDSEATLNDGVNRITGSSISIFPDNDKIELGGGSARIQLAAAADKPRPAAAKPADDSKFESIEVKPHRGISGNIAGQIREIKGPAHLVIAGKDAADTMNVNADTITFSYAKADDTMPAEMMLKGHVEFVHTQGTFHADEATINLTDNKARFQGNVTIANAQIRGAKTNSFEFDLNTREFVMGPGQVDSFSMKATDPAPAKKP